MICADYHLHSSFSSDSDAPLEAMIEAAIGKGLHTICMTEHHDIDFPADKYKLDFQLDDEAYWDRLTSLKERYKDRIEIRIGVELGLMAHIGAEISAFAKRHPYDFIIGSSHLVDRIDPYYPEFYEGRSEKEAYRMYFESILENAAVIKDYDVYGHLDYVVRYGPNRNRYFRYADYADIFETILKQLIADGKGIEINTAGLMKELGYPHPHMDILKRYRELGGEIVTVGSDAHAPENIAYGFKEAEAYLLKAGFTYYTVFRNRKPAFVKLSKIG